MTGAEYLAAKEAQAESPGCDATATPIIGLSSASLRDPFIISVETALKYMPPEVRDIYAKAPETRAAAEALAEAGASLLLALVKSKTVGELKGVHNQMARLDNEIAKHRLAQWEEAKK